MYIYLHSYRVGVDLTTPFNCWEGTRFKIFFSFLCHNPYSVKETVPFVASVSRLGMKPQLEALYFYIKNADKGKQKDSPISCDKDS